MGKFEEYIALHEKGVLTEREVASQFLIMVALEGDASNAAELLELLPAKLQLAVRSQLDEIQESGFKWRPFMFGKGYSEMELVELNKQIHAIDNAIRSARLQD